MLPRDVGFGWPYSLFLWAALVGVILWIFRRYVVAGRVCRSKAWLDGRTVVITGCNTGIGKETAIDLAKRGARVISGCRSEERGKKAEVDIRRESGNSNVHFRKLDLASFASIREFAKEVLSEESRLDILINNAGVMCCPYTKTEDGFEMQFGVNHLGHFLLTNLLLDKIKEAPEGRIVVVSSSAHAYSSKLDLDTVHSEEHYGRFGAYVKSKFANVLFANALSKRLSGTKVTVNSLDPGAVKTGIQRHTLLFRVPKALLGWLLMKNAKEGAQTSIHVAVSEDIKDVTGKYFVNCKVSAASKLAMDEEAAEQLWAKSVEWTGL